MIDDAWFQELAAASPLEVAAPAPSCAKSRIYSALIDAQEEDGPLLGLTETRQAGGALCVFERLIEILPVGETLQSFQYCKICHGRVLGERVENAPIYWPCCPYSEFQNR